MSQNYENLRMFQQTDALVRDIYRITAGFPSEGYALQSQTRRGCLAALANIVEGSLMAGVDASDASRKPGSTDS